MTNSSSLKSDISLLAAGTQTGSLSRNFPTRSDLPGHLRLEKALLCHLDEMELLHPTGCRDRQFGGCGEDHVTRHFEAREAFTAVIDQLVLGHLGRAGGGDDPGAADLPHPLIR